MHCDMGETQYLPALHTVHADAPAVLTAAVPETEEHGKHAETDVLPGKAFAKPALQSTHVCCPGSATYWPAGHGRHTVAPVVGE